MEVTFKTDIPKTKRPSQKLTFVTNQWLKELTPFLEMNTKKNLSELYHFKSKSFTKAT